LRLSFKTSGTALRAGTRPAEILSRLSRFFSLGVSRGDISLFKGTGRDHEGRRIADLSRRTSVAASDFRLPITAQ
jgi:hypothetical protein